MNEVQPPPGQDPLIVSDHSRLFNLDPIIMRIIHSRGYDTPEKIDAFLYPRLSSTHSPFLMDGMYDAVARIRKAIESDQQMGIFADSDLDGVTSLAVVHLLLSRMKKEPFIRYLKNDENYGLTREIIDEFKDHGVQLMITVDSGTRDIAEISYARSVGIDVIVTDHHEQDSRLPDAIIINPKKFTCRYPFKHLAGVGIAFKLCLSILMSYQPSYKKKYILITASQSGYMLSIISDCIVEQTCYGPDYEFIIESIRGIERHDSIIVYNDPVLVELLSGQFKDIRTFDLADFIKRIVRSDNSTIENFIQTSASRSISDEEKLSFLTAILLDAQMTGSEKINEFVNSVMGLVAIGSVADVIPLTGENRLLVKRGIDILNNKKHQAIALLLNGDKVNSRTIGWGIAPLLNTPGRIGMTELAVRFFIEKDRNALKSIISEIKSLNEKRKAFINEFCSKTIEEINERSINVHDRLIFIKTDLIPDGYAGLIANRISDETGMPTIVTVLPGKQGLIKGSGRSRSGGKFFSIVEKFRDRFDRIGGHENAFGFTVSSNDINEIILSIDNAMKENTVHENQILIDAELDISRITIDFIEQLSYLEPFGAGNEEPLFISRNLQVETFMMFGKKHGKYVVDEKNRLTAIGWGMGLVMKDYFESGKPIELVYRLENNSFNGSVSPRMIVNSIRFAC